MKYEEFLRVVTNSLHSLELASCQENRVIVNIDGDGNTRIKSDTLEVVLKGKSKKE